jgi:hypothetical protein
MRPGNLRHFICVLLLPMVALASPPSTIAPKSRAIDLAYVPQETTESVRPVLKDGITERAIRVDLVDVREIADPLVVGRQLKDDAQKFEWRVSEAPLAKVDAFVHQILGRWFVKLSPDATPRLSMQLARYYVTETRQIMGSTYLAEVGIRAVLQDANGTTLWAGTAAGESRRYGEDKSADNCNEVLSDALTSATSQLVSQPGLQAQWAPQPADEMRPTTALSPGALLDELLKLKGGGMSDDILVAFVKKQKLGSPLTADDMVAWKQKGIPDAAIQAAVEGH